jgi:5-methylcytosine-specific restriction endonuclease McrA
MVFLISLNLIGEFQMEVQIHPRCPHSNYLELHNEALAISKRFRKCEAELLDVIMRVETRRIYLEFELTSLHDYCIEMLGLSPHVANDFINVTRTSFNIPELAEAIHLGKTTVSKARKICSVITNKNAKEWIDLVIHCSCRVVEKAVASAHPRAAVRESLKYVSSDVLELRLAVSEDWSQLLTKTKDRLSQAKQRAISTEEALFIVMSEAHERNDRIRKAERSKTRKIRKHKEGVRAESSRAIPAAVQHEVNLRDQGQCIHIYPNGMRCGNKRWIDQHHNLPFAQGGRHTADNLETLCSAHHRMKHMH